MAEFDPAFVGEVSGPEGQSGRYVNDHECDICGDQLSVCVDNNKDAACDICGKVLSTVNVVVIPNVGVEYGLFYIPYPVYSYMIFTQAEGTNVVSIEFSVDNGPWINSFMVISPFTQLRSFRFRVTDSDGVVRNYTYANGRVR